MKQVTDLGLDLRAARARARPGAVETATPRRSGACASLIRTANGCLGPSDQALRAHGSDVPWWTSAIRIGGYRRRHIV